MLMSSKGRYGLAAAAFLARLYMEARCDSASASQISREAGLPQKYLEAILRDLKAADVIIAERGVKGGYRLSRPPQETTVGAVLRAAEGDLAPVPCLSDRHKNNGCASCDDCDTKIAWEEIYDRINDVFDSITLDEMVKRNE